MKWGRHCSGKKMNKNVDWAGSSHYPRDDQEADGHDWDLSISTA